jgi:Uma2 family endonuclease
MPAVATRMTMEELLALPDDGVERWLINGELRERPRDPTMPYRNRFHSQTMACTSTELMIWNRLQPPPRGSVLTGDAGVRLQHDPETIFGVDVMYVAANVMLRQTADSTIIDGIPTLAAEILSPSDTIEDIHEKIRAFLAAGVPLVWIIDPELRTVTVHRPGARPQLFNEDQELTAEPHLPGFRVPVKRLFE